MIIPEKFEEEDLEEKLLQPYYHILQVKGKLLRKKIPLAFNYWLKLPEEKLNEVVDLVNMIHNGTLLLDDIQDNSRFRRTIPAAHRIYGVALASNTSVHILLLATERLLRLNNPQLSPVTENNIDCNKTISRQDHEEDAYNICCEEILELIRGQGIDIYWRDAHICPSEEDYKLAIIKKTGSMFSISVRLLQLFSNDKRDYTRVVQLISLYFQIRDDYCNINQQEALEDWPGKHEEVASNKEEQFCEDLTEGKFSLPIIHALQFPEGAPILNILKLRTEDKSLKKYCISLLNKLGSMEYTRTVLMELHKEVEAEIARLGGNPLMDDVLEELLTWKTY